MKVFKKDDLIVALKKIGIKKNSTILVHSGLNYIGRMKNTNNNLIPKKIFEILTKYVGKKGTILFPAFYNDYSKRNKRFDLLKSPPCKTLGILPEFVYKKIKFKRSKNPLNSLMGIGKNAKYICDESNFSDYGEGSAWQRLYESNADLIFLGVPLFRAMTFIHYIEFRVGVPHMYIKKFETNVVNNKKIISKGVNCYVRYRKFNVNVNQKKFEKELINKKILKIHRLGSGKICSVNIKRTFDLGVKKLSENPFYFLEKKPKFKRNSIPLI